MAASKVPSPPNADASHAPTRAGISVAAMFCSIVLLAMKTSPGSIASNSRRMAVSSKPASPLVRASRKL